MMNTLIASGRTTQWSRYMTGGAYSDAIQFGNYKIETQEDERDKRFLLWSPRRPCIAMALDKDDDVAVIDSIEYSPTVTGRMKRGDGTRDMIHTALKFLKENGARKVQLVDNSYVVCEGTKVRLGLMYFFKTGQTWYEKYFGFQPEVKYMQRYARAKEIQATLGLDDVPCNAFTDDVLAELITKTGLVFFSSVVWERSL